MERKEKTEFGPIVISSSSTVEGWWWEPEGDNWFTLTGSQRLKINTYLRRTAGFILDRCMWYKLWIDTDVDKYKGKPLILPEVCVDAANRFFGGRHHYVIFHITHIQEYHVG